MEGGYWNWSGLDLICRDMTDLKNLPENFEKYGLLGTSPRRSDAISSLGIFLLLFYQWFRWLDCETIHPAQPTRLPMGNVNAWGGRLQPSTQICFHCSPLQGSVLCSRMLVSVGTWYGIKERDGGRGRGRERERRIKDILNFWDKLIIMHLFPQPWASTGHLLCV